MSCKYCDGKNEIVDTYDETVIIEGSVMYVEVDVESLHWVTQFDIRYCPMCGSRLHG